MRLARDWGYELEPRALIVALRRGGLIGKPRARRCALVSADVDGVMATARLSGALEPGARGQYSEIQEASVGEATVLRAKEGRRAKSVRVIEKCIVKSGWKCIGRW